MARKYQLHGAFPSKAGDSAYEVALKNGFKGTEQEWLASLEGAPGKDAENVDLSGYIEAPEVAAIGQTIMVKEVDENGKPIAWVTAYLPDGIKTSFTTLWTGSLSEGMIIANSSAKDYDLVFVTFYQIVSGRPHIFDVSFQPKQLKMAGSDYGVLLPLCLIDGTPTEQMLRIFEDYKAFTLIDTAKPYIMTKITGVKFNA